MGEQNFATARNDITSEEALGAFKALISFEKATDQEKNSSLGSDPQQIISRFIGKYSSKGDWWYSLLGDYDRFSKWAYKQLGCKPQKTICHTDTYRQAIKEIQAEFDESLWWGITFWGWVAQREKTLLAQT